MQNTLKEVNMTKEKELQNRTSRSADTRAKKVARKPWQPPSMLETPPAPEGYEYRWIRAEIVGQEDKKNVTARLREGFDLVRAEELGDFVTRFSGITMTCIATGVIWIGQPESFTDVILYDNLHVLLWVGGLFFALRGNRT